MAEVGKVLEPKNNWNSASHVCTWSGLSSGDTGSPLEMPTASDRSVQVAGTFSGATVVLQGTNDGVNWVTLTDPLGTALSFTSGGLIQVGPISQLVRPSVSGGSGSTDITCTLIVRRRG